MTKDKLWTEYENALLNKGLTKIRLAKLKTMYLMARRGLNKPIHKASREDIEKFIAKLHRDTFKREDGHKYSGSTKSDIKKFLKQYFKWKFGEDEFYPKQVSWLKTNISKDEKPTPKPVLSIKQAMLLANSFNKQLYTILILLLFDSGFRIQELLSAMKKDLYWALFDDKNSCFWLRCNRSKTITRTVPVSLFTEELKNFVNSSYYELLKDDDLLFPLKYANVLKLMKANGMKLFDKVITPHCLRHSSATHYANEFDGDSIALSVRYGWSFNSKELQNYVRGSGAHQKRGVKKIFAGDISKLKSENEELKQRLNTLENKMETIFNKFVSIEKQK